MQHVGIDGGGYRSSECIGSIFIIGVTVCGVRGGGGSGGTSGEQQRRGSKRSGRVDSRSSSRSSDGGRSRNGGNVIGCGKMVQDARTFMQAVSRDYGCFVTSAGCHRGRGGGGCSRATVLLRGPRGPRLTGTSWRNRGWNLAGGYQIRIRWTGGGPALQDGWVARDLGR